nr:MAG TPA: hypothetical protein [Caudoviricetes sp.]
MRAVVLVEGELRLAVRQPEQLGQGDGGQLRKPRPGSTTAGPESAEARDDNP